MQDIKWEIGMMNERKTQGNQSGEKLLRVLEHMVLCNGSQKLQDIARAVEMNASTTLRFLNTLIDCGYVRQEEETAQYMPTFKICALANRMHREDGLRRVAHPYMEELSALFGESVCLAIEEGKKAVYVEVLRVKNQSLMAVQAVGNAAQMYCNGIGKLFLSAYSGEALERYLEEEKLTAHTEHTITDKEELKKEVEQVRRQGYAYDNQERELGARCIAFPVRDAGGKIVAGISVTGPYSRLTDELIMPRLEEFRRITGELSWRLGYGMFR